jgi:hypothetical protein
VLSTLESLVIKGPLKAYPLDSPAKRSGEAPKIKISIVEENDLMGQKKIMNQSTKWATISFWNPVNQMGQD